MSNVYFGYVHTYTFDPSALGDLAYAVAEQERRARVGAKEPPLASESGDRLLQRLAAWARRVEQEAAC
jgi:hypothetical protein